MTIQECYRLLGGDYDEALRGIPSAALIDRFVRKFLDDKSYEQLCEAVAANDRESAFRAAHTLKGVCANLRFAALRDSASELTELLRPENAAITDEALHRLEKVTADYAVTVGAIREYIEG